MLRHPWSPRCTRTGRRLPLVRRWADQLRTDLARAVRLPARNSPPTPPGCPAGPGRSGCQPARRWRPERDRPFDRRRYAYLVLALAVLGRPARRWRCGELAERSPPTPHGSTGSASTPRRKPDRDAFVDAVAWLQDRGALRLADGNARALGRRSRPPARPSTTSTATSLRAVYRPTRVLQHLTSVTACSTPPAPGHADRAAQPGAADRPAAPGAPVLEHPVVYYAELDGRTLRHCAAPAVAADVDRLTGMAVERRAEGVALHRYLRPVVRSPIPRRRHGRAGRAAAGRPDQRRPGRAIRTRPPLDCCPPPPPPNDLAARAGWIDARCRRVRTGRRTRRAR